MQRAERPAGARSAVHDRREKPAARSGESGSGDDDTLDNRWLDKEYDHNSATAENDWVSPSEDWVQNGPDGPGYYALSGNSDVKLDPDYAQ